LKKKVLCPNHVYEKILLAYDPDRRRIWVHCSDRNCSRWVQVDINNWDGVVATMMPKGYHFDFEKTPTLVHGV
jgi:hypothetical protein